MPNDKYVTASVVFLSIKFTIDTIKKHIEANKKHIHLIFSFLSFFMIFPPRSTVKETIGVGVNEKAALSSDKNCPFVYINFDFTLVNKVASL